MTFAMKALSLIPYENNEPTVTDGTPVPPPARVPVPQGVVLCDIPVEARGIIHADGVTVLHCKPPLEMEPVLYYRPLQAEHVEPVLYYKREITRADGVTVSENSQGAASDAEKSYTLVKPIFTQWTPIRRFYRPPLQMERWWSPE